MINSLIPSGGGGTPLGSVGGSADAVVVRHGNHLFGYERWQGNGNANGKFLRDETMSSAGDTPLGWFVGYGNEIYPAGEDVGEDGTGKNMPPYLAVASWKRLE